MIRSLALRSTTRVIAVAVALLLLPAIARAHPHLKRSDPTTGARLAFRPRTLRLWFDEVPELRFTTLILRDSSGRTFTLGATVQDSADTKGVYATVSESLPEGNYTLAWRAVGADGHAGEGIITFTVLPSAPSAAAAPTNAVSATPSVRPEGAPSTQLSVGDPTYIAARTLTFAALLIIIGAAVFRFVVLSRAQLSGGDAQIVARTASLGLIAVLVLLVADAIRLGLQWQVMSGGPASAGLMDILTTTRWGAAWMTQVGAAVVAGLGFASSGRSAIGWPLALVAAIALSATSAIGGHASAASSSRGIAMVADSMHVLGAAGWLGSLATMIIVALPGLAATNGGQRWSSIARLVHAFSPTALVFTGIVAATGLTSAWMHLGSVPALWETQYGRTLLVKLVVLSGAVGTGAYNWLRVRPALGSETATRRLQRSAAGELLIGFVVVGVTAILVATETPNP